MLVDLQKYSAISNWIFWALEKIQWFIENWPNLRNYLQYGDLCLAYPTRYLKVKDVEICRIAYSWSKESDKSTISMKVTTLEIAIFY
jgi:hypothetical protein